ncbi:MAG: hypothetical protein ACK56I_31175 [bacterium]
MTAILRGIATALQSQLPWSARKRCRVYGEAAGAASPFRQARRETLSRLGPILALSGPRRSPSPGRGPGVPGGRLRDAG